MDEPGDAAGVGALIARLVRDARAYARAEADYYRALATQRATDAAIAAGLAFTALFLLMAVVTATLVGVLILLGQAIGLGWAIVALFVTGMAVIALLVRAAIARARRITAPVEEPR